MTIEDALKKLHETSYKANHVMRSYRVLQYVDDIIKEIANREGVSTSAIMQAAVLMLNAKAEPAKPPERGYDMSPV